MLSEYGFDNLDSLMQQAVGALSAGDMVRIVLDIVPQVQVGKRRVVDAYVGERRRVDAYRISGQRRDDLRVSSGKCMTSMKDARNGRRRHGGTVYSMCVELGGGRFVAVRDSGAASAAVAGRFTNDRGASRTLHGSAPLSYLV